MHIYLVSSPANVSGFLCVGGLGLRFLSAQSFAPIPSNPSRTFVRDNRIHSVRCGFKRCEFIRLSVQSMLPIVWRRKFHSNCVGVAGIRVLSVTLNRRRRRPIVSSNSSICSRTIVGNICAECEYCNHVFVCECNRLSRIVVRFYYDILYSMRCLRSLAFTMAVAKLNICRSADDDCNQKHNIFCQCWLAGFG